jgi:hypothetical protein
LGRRSDFADPILELPPNPRGGDCAVLDAQVDVPHRPNSSGALAKSRFPRTVPATQAVLSRYADYQIERMDILGDADCDMVFVALYHENRWVRRSHIVHIAVLCAAGHRLRLCGTGAYVPPSYGGQELGAPR